MRLLQKLSVFADCVLSGLTLGELETLPGAWLTGLFALLSPWVTAQEASGFQGRAEFRIVKDQGTGNRELCCVSLAMDSTALGDDADVELIFEVRDLEGFKQLTLEGQRGESLFEALIVDSDLTGSSGEPDAGDGGFTTAGGGESFFAHGS